MSYVLAVAKDHHVVAGAGPLRADALAAKLSPRAWQRLSAGPGAKGHRWYDWAWVAIKPGRPGCHWLLVRRHRRIRELAYYRCYSPGHRPLAAFVRVAGRRWTTEENFEASKGLAGLDEHQVRTWAPGTGGSPSPCSPWLSSPWPASPNAASGPRQPG